MYLGYYDSSKHITARDKALEACARYKRRWLVEAAVVLCNVADVEAVGDLGEGVEVRAVGSVPPNTFFVGHDEPVMAL